MTTAIGTVTKTRYRQLQKEGKRIVQLQTEGQWRLGDIALEICPIQQVGGEHGEVVTATIYEYAESIGIPGATLMDYRWVASRWPAETRVRGIVWTIHSHLASLKNRVRMIEHPPPNPVTGRREWTCDNALRAAKRTPQIPRSTTEKVNKIYDLVHNDDQAAVQAVHHLLQREEVAHKALADPHTRHIVNRVQRERDEQVQQSARERTPAIQRVERSIEIMELLGACAAFVAAMNRGIKALHEHRITDDERAAVRDKLIQVRAAADWCESAVETGDITLDDQLSKLLRGE